MRNARGPLLAVLAVLVVAAAVVWALRPQPVLVETSVVDRGPLAESVEVEARTRARDPFLIAAPAAGRVARLPWREGDVLHAGEVVTQLNRLDADAALTQARAQLREAREQLAGVETLRPKGAAIAQGQARIASARATRGAAAQRADAAALRAEQAGRDADRATTLERSGDLSQSQGQAARLAAASAERELRAAREELGAAAAEVRSAEDGLAELRAKVADPEYLKGVYAARIGGITAQIAALQDAAARTTVRAPADGRVLRVLQRSEQYVNAGAPLLELADPRRLEIVADVLSPDVVAIRPGDPIVVLRGAGSRAPRARVRLIEPSGFTKVSALGIEEQRVNVVGDFVDDPRGLGDGYRLDVRIVTWQGNDVLRIPTGALFRCGDDWCAFTVTGGRAHRTTVRAGHTGEDRVEVRAGCARGDRVILNPSDRIAEGTPVTE